MTNCSDIFLFGKSFLKIDPDHTQVGIHVYIQSISGKKKKERDSAPLRNSLFSHGMFHFNAAVHDYCIALFFEKPVCFFVGDAKLGPENV